LDQFLDPLPVGVVVTGKVELPGEVIDDTLGQGELFFSRSRDGREFLDTAGSVTSSG